MHYSSFHSCVKFAELYGKENMVVVDIGGRDVNGSVRQLFEGLKMKYICVDTELAQSVDIVMKPNEPIPLETGSVDMCISTSCFEHDPCFWITFKEMCRITKLGGFIYINAPSRGDYHTFPGDNWRFYGDAAQALVYWSGLPYGNTQVYPVTIEETFHIERSMNSEWNHWGDFICIWKRVNEKEDSSVVSNEVKYSSGLLKTKLREMTFEIINMTI